MNKAIAIINPSGLGGAEKRYLSLFAYLQRDNEDIYLIINQGLLELAREKGLLLDSKNILIVDLSYDFSWYSKLGTWDDRRGEEGKRRLGDYLENLKTRLLDYLTSRKNESTKARGHEGARARKHESTRAREHEGTRARKHESTRARKLESEKTRKHENTRAREHEGTRARKHENTKTGKLDFLKTKKRLNDLLDSDSIQNSKFKIQNFVGRYSSFIKSWIRWLEFKKKIVPIITNNEITTIYTVWLAGIWLIPLKSKLKLKLIHSFNDSGFSSISKNIIDFYKSEYWIIKKADQVDCLSQRLKTGLIKRIKGLQDNKLTVSPCSFIDYSNLYAEDKENVITFCGRLEKIKNPLLFLEAVNLIKDILCQNWEVVIIGTGSLEEEMQSYIREQKLQCVKRLGYIPDPQKYLRKSKIFISIQQEDNYPSQSLMEAMACENAIIASNVGETKLLIDDKCGKLVLLNAMEISDCICDLISNTELLAEYGKNARIKVLENHTIEKYAAYIRQIMQ